MTTASTARRAPRSTASLRHRLAERGVDASLLLLVPALVFTLVLFVYPFSYGIVLTLQPNLATQQQSGGGVFANYVAFFTDPFCSTPCGSPCGSPCPWRCSTWWRRSRSRWCCAAGSGASAS
ncbi:sugar ABC transporter permease [Propioniciclava coleopterorum]|uniref:sugar ABC transporter permease n=1 Tax=Propioniciclava coleopterorum TaxID=2714937 RepID=UPI0019806F3B|nr:sugar ABC transporter permease [Propioniciclava coleopterorum]